MNNMTAKFAFYSIQNDAVILSPSRSNAIFPSQFWWA